MSTQQQFLVVGDAQSAEFDELRRLIGHSATQHASSVEHAVNRLTDSVLPPTILLLQTYPGQYTQADVQRFMQLHPQARIYCICGSWCEGQLRTGVPLKDVTTLYSHQWLDSRSRPGTILVDEPQSHKGRSQEADTRPVVLVCSDSTTLRNAWRDALQAFGYQTIATRLAADIDWDRVTAAVLDGVEAGPLLPVATRLRQRYAKIPLAALVDFAWHDQRRQLREAGCDVVMRKPVELSTLYEALQQ